MTIPAWTYSQLEKFETCPKQYYHVRVKRDVIEPPTEHTKWGEEVHTALEHRVMHGTPLPEGMQQWEGIAAKLCALPGTKLCEYKMAVDNNFKQTGWKTAWTRGIADLVVINGKKAAVFDHKTGKRKLTEQLSLYAAYVFIHFPEVEEVTTGFIWLKEKKIDKETFHRDQLHEIWQGFLPRVIKLESAYDRDSWPARPSGLCKGWCHVRECAHWKSKA